MTAQVYTLPNRRHAAQAPETAAGRDFPPRASVESINGDWGLF